MSRDIINRSPIFCYETGGNIPGHDWDGGGLLTKSDNILTWRVDYYLTASCLKEDSNAVILL